MTTDRTARKSADSSRNRSTEVHRTDEKPSIKVATHEEYGCVDRIEIRETECPACEPNEVLIEVRAASVNPYDWHNLTGTPLLVRLGNGFRRPKSGMLGIDVAGVVKGVGKGVRRFEVGDAVFGCAKGSLAEVACAEEELLALKPENVSFEEAAAVPVGALTAVQGLRDHGQLESGDHVLVNGASGGVGTYAVQLAKYFGAHVTGVCGPNNVEMVKRLGADHVVDYTNADFTTNLEVYDLILDNVGNRRMSHYKRCLSSRGRYVVVGGPKGKLLGPVLHMIKALIAFKSGTRRASVFMAQQVGSDIGLFSELLASGAIKTEIDSVHPFEKIHSAFKRVETGHASGKVIVTM